MKGERENVHGTRNRILDYIEDNPKATLTMISSALKINTSTLRYHLKILEKKGEIFSTKSGGKRRYHKTGGSNVQKERFSMNQRRVLNIIGSKPGITRKEIKSRLNITSRGISYILVSLKKKHMIWEDNGKYTAVTKKDLTDRMLVILAKELIDGKIDENTFFALKNEIQKNKK